MFKFRLSINNKSTHAIVDIYNEYNITETFNGGGA